ncbi:protein phosphatase 1H isoform X1 [Mustela nigripes]|uniref:Protein phosphatase 1H isoform X2 n=1 Tax=Mustela putorius furo TaxID=9669 RepID=A0A8U0UTD3_MUSPF|nr:protein phosphatase 1H isoform X2 [Mustela putorius furo]XP_059259588.1 protein phosphatase 1H isoform X1 [Mustela nigripes]
MLTRVKSAVANFMGGIMAGSSGSEHSGGGCGGSDLPLRFPYGRPEFLGLSQDEVECSADHIARPILILKETRRLPWATGYAEVINAGKSTHNEDQASCEVLTVKKKAGAITSTPNRNSAKRRSSLPNGEGLQLKENSESEGVSCHYWSLFDGHAGSGAAVVASRLLQHHVTEQLQDIVEILKNSAVLPPTCLGEEPENTPAHSRTLTRAASLRGGVGAPGSPSTPPTRFFTEKKIPHECLVIGALESAFKEMDLQIERERSSYNISGGCTALIVVCLLGKLYVANAGDSRAIIIRNGEIIPMSSEFTPETERQRLQYLAFMQPHLLGNEFTHLEFPRRVQRKELGKKMLYRDFNMTGWKHMDTLTVKRESGLPCAGPPQGAGSSLHLLLCGFGFDSFGNTDGWQEKGSMRAYKTIEDDDLKFPLIYGEGKKARVMATIGVTRGLGDHDLKVHDSNIYIKPFLSSAPEVRVYDLSRYEHGADDVLILATDGLWDVLSNEEVAEAVTQFLPNCDPDDPHRYTLAAQDLVMRARGVLKDRGWRISNDRLGSGDDISVYVIPLIHGNKLS